MEPMMKAVGIRKYGGPEVLEALELPVPVPGPGQALVRVAAAALNPADAAFRAGQFKYFIRQPMPIVLGNDLAGVVEAVGPGVTRFQPGDRVYAMLPTPTPGADAEFARVAAEHLAPAPGSLTLAEAAAVPLTALTALQALRDKAHLEAGQRLLVYGASGGVGTFAVQIGKTMGAHVTAVCSGRNADLARSLGADAVRDYTREDALSGEFDLIFDAVNTVKFDAARPALSKGGALVSVNPVLAANPLVKLQAALSGRRAASLLVQASGADLETLNAWISAGKVRPVIERTYRLDELAEAHRHIETKRARGKLVVLVDEALANAPASDELARLTA